MSDINLSLADIIKKNKPKTGGKWRKNDRDSDYKPSSIGKKNAPFVKDSYGNKKGRYNAIGRRPVHTLKSNVRSFKLQGRIQNDFITSNATSKGFVSDARSIIESRRQFKDQDCRSVIEGRKLNDERRREDAVDNWKEFYYKRKGNVTVTGRGETLVCRVTPSKEKSSYVCLEQGDPLNTDIEEYRNSIPKTSSAKPLLARTIINNNFVSGRNSNHTITGNRHRYVEQPNDIMDYASSDEDVEMRYEPSQQQRTYGYSYGSESPSNTVDNKISANERETWNDKFVASGYKIIISNLHNQVTPEDIMELFGDIGSLLKAKVVGRGKAEAIYRTREDALKAIDVYHNRQLDGLPMKCVLVSNVGGGSSKSKTRKEESSSSGLYMDKVVSSRVYRH